MLSSQNFFTVDIHTHIIPENLPKWKEKFGYGEFVQLEHHKPCCARMMMDDAFFREIESNCWDPEQRLKECGHHQVDGEIDQHAAAGGREALQHGVDLLAAADHVGGSLVGAGPRIASVAFAPEVVQVAVAQTGARIVGADDGWPVVEVPFDDVVWFAAWILSFGDRAVAIAPEDLRAEIIRRLEAVAGG